MDTIQKERNIELTYRLYKEIFEKGNLDSYEELVDKNVKIHCPESWQCVHPNEMSGRDNVKMVDQAYLDAFKLKDVKMEDVIAQDDKVVVRWSCKGTHVGEFFGKPATNKSFSLIGQSIYRYSEEGKVCEVWQSWDMLGLLKQIDAIKISK